jgi:hypothetical protein
MGGGFKDYLRECAAEAPNAFRRGMVLMTILANVAILAALYLGWHLNAFTSFQLATAAAATAGLEIIVFFPYRLWKANKARIAELEAELASSSVPGPDWKIRELFHHIQPDGLLENNKWQEVGADVLDKLASGQLMAWGRRVRSRPLQHIGTMFWADANFTFWFLAEGQDDSEHAKSHSLIVADEAYSDIRVNKAQAKRIWPRG